MASSPDNIDYDRTVNVAGLHAAAARERSATPIGTTPVSLWVVLATGVVASLLAGKRASSAPDHDHDQA